MATGILVIFSVYPGAYEKSPSAFVHSDHEGRRVHLEAMTIAPPRHFSFYPSSHFRPAPLPGVPLAAYGITSSAVIQTSGRGGSKIPHAFTIHQLPNAASAHHQGGLCGGWREGLILLLLGFKMELLAWASGSSFSLAVFSILPGNPHPVLARSPLLPLALTFVSHTFT